MSVSAAINIGLLVVAILLLLGALFSALGALRARMGASHSAYGVGRQKSRQAMLVGFIRAGVFLVLSLIAFGVYGLSAMPDNVLSREPEASITPAATATSATSDPTATATTVPASPTMGAVVSTATATLAPPTPTQTPTATPTITPTPVPTALVTSEVGLYLREAPGGTQEVELLPLGAELVLLEGEEVVDGTEWRQVRSPEGNEGWVATEFLEFQQ